jgi:hypothetical protein
MKTTPFLPLFAGILCASGLIYLPARANAQNYSVRAATYDISYDLDLRAVVDLFADSRSIEDFELRLNDNNYDISNLDLNRDGRIDYLRVVEMYESNVHLIAIQAVLAQNIFQDVATIALERGRTPSQSYIQIIGNPYIYGNNYIIEPVFYRTPIIFDWFWRTTRYVVWHSPYYWNYYPKIYVRRPILQTDIYITRVHDRYYANTRNKYSYATVYRNQPIMSRLQPSLSRNDYARSNPNYAFDRRNKGVQNTRDIHTKDRYAAPRPAPAQPDRQTPPRTTHEQRTVSSGRTTVPANTNTRSGNSSATSTTRSGGSTRDANSTRSGTTNSQNSSTTTTRKR